MAGVTRILNAIEHGDTQAVDKLLPLVYEELRLLAAQKLSQEKPGQTLQATALVHEAYLRLVEGESQNWNSRGHFFKAAAEAMRRILVENARRKKSLKHGGDKQRVELSDSGAGMSPEVQSRLFEPFFTTKDHGSGLGLSTSYGIVLSHGGRIAVESREEHGTTFCIGDPSVLLMIVELYM